MDFALSEEQEMLRKSARDFLTTECPKSVLREIESSEAGYSPELWSKMAALGWIGLALPEEYGGAGLSLLDLAILLEEFGRAALPGPMFATIALGALPLLEWGSQEQKISILPGVASGETILTMAYSEPEVDEDPKWIAAKASRRNGTFDLTGTKLFVSYANTADYMLLAARTSGSPGDSEGLTMFILDTGSPGITRALMQTIACQRQSEVRFDGTPVPEKALVGPQDKALGQLTATLKKAAALQCAEMVGGAQQELEITAQHAKTRTQFDRPLGTFQAVQHRLADMYIDVNGARWVTYQALWRLSEGLPSDKEVAVAKAFTNLACQRVAAGAQQLHGGIGVDKDYDLHFYFRRAKAFELSLGSTAAHLKVLESEFARPGQ